MIDDIDRKDDDNEKIRETEMENIEEESIEVEITQEHQTDPVDAYWKAQAGILKSSFVNTSIIIITIIAFLYSQIAGDAFVSKFEQRSEYVAAGRELYRLITSMFLHADLEHLFSNMLILFFVGANAEHDIGHIPYLILYFFAGIAGNLLSTAYDLHIGEFIPSIGASGAVFGVIGAVAIIVLFGRKNLRRGSNLIIRLAFMIILSVYSGFTADNIDNAAHIGGLLGGALFTLIITLIMKKEYTMEEWL
ncbi:rhomboid family intramembrane serine protease [Butyrivibrio sp. VCD2006]|uniref:rhomboid family intramembrane serine protease n=1 Tax=Butyrivibrio sp. VCD2006 TaxID=1280664 RepID=UPI00041FAA88|nr:rhomboid family intramembrane serine protease [Butyrivibrio sp. VCD2006]